MKFKDTKYNYLAEQAKPDGSFQSALILAHAQTVFKDALIKHLESELDALKKQNAELAAELTTTKATLENRTRILNERRSQLTDREAALACAVEALKNACHCKDGPFRDGKTIEHLCDPCLALSTPAIARYRLIHDAREKVIEACKTGKPRADIDKLITELERTEGGI